MGHAGVRSALRVAAVFLVAVAGGIQTDRCAAQDPSALGILGPEPVSLEVTVPENGLWRSPHGTFVSSDTVTVRDTSGRRLVRVNDAPGERRFRYRLDGCIRFSSSDAGREVRISYRYRPRRIALLPVVAGSDYEDEVPTMLAVLVEELIARGFVAAPSDDVIDALVEARGLAEDAPPPSGGARMSALARHLDAAYVVLPSVAASEDAVFAGFQSYAWLSGSSKRPTLHTSTRSVVHRTMDVSVGITVFRGPTGDEVAQKCRSGSRRVRFRRFGPVRRSLIQELTGKLVADWRDSSL